MSEDETLRMAAEVVDKFSGPLRNMQRTLQKLSDQVKGSHKAGADQAKQHTKAFDDLHHSIRDVSERVRGALNPAFAAFGVGALSAAGGVAAVAEAIKDFAGTSRQLSDVSKEVGFSIQQLRVYEALANRVGSSRGAMDAGLENFAKNMEELRRNRGELQQFFVGQMSPGTKALGDALRHTADNATALREVLEALGHVQGPDAEVQKKRLLEAFGLPLELSRKSGQELKTLLEELNRNIGSLSDEQIKKGEEAQRSFDRLRESAGRLKDEVGAGLAPAITRMTDSIRSFVEENRDGLIKTLDGVAHAIENADWKGFAADVRDAAAAVSSVVEKLGGWKTVLEGLVAIKVISWLLPIVTAVGSLARGLTSIAGLAAAPVWVTALLGLTQRGSSGPGGVKTWQDIVEEGRGKGLSAKDLARSDFAAGGTLAPITAAGVHGALHGGEWWQPGYQGGGEKPEETIRKGVKEGFIDGLREGFHRQSFIGDGFGGGAGVIKASYGGGGFGGGVGGGSGAAPGAPMGALGGAGAGAGGGVDAVRRALGGGGGGGGDGDPSLTGNAYLKSQRASLMAEVNQDPATKHLLHQMMATEGGGAPTVEALFNRTAMIRQRIPGYGIKDELNSGFYGPIKHGVAQQRLISAKEAARDQKILDEVGSGSDHIKSRTDQGMVGDPNWRGPGRVKIPGSNEIYNFWHGRRRGIDFGTGDSQRFADEQEGHVTAEAAAAHKNAFIAAARAARSRMPRGDQASSSEIHADLLGSARRAGMIGGQSHKVTGDASVRIDLNGFPRGTRTASSANGMFKQVSLNRGRVPYADQEA